MTRTLVAAACFVAMSAAAQSSPPPPPQDPPPPPPPSQETPMPPPMTSAPTATPYPTTDVPLQQPVQPGRLRWGGSGTIGTFIPFPTISIGAEGLLGWQINRIVSVFGVVGFTGGIGIGGSIASSGATINLNLVSYAYLGAMAEALFGDLFFVGGGAGLAHGAWTGNSISGSSAGAAELTTVVAGGFMPTLNARLGFGFGGQGSSGARRQFSVALDGRVLFAFEAVATRVQGSSTGAGASVTMKELSVGFAPMLMFGWDNR